MPRVVFPCAKLLSINLPGLNYDIICSVITLSAHKSSEVTLLVTSNLLIQILLDYIVN